MAVRKTVIDALIKNMRTQNDIIEDDDHELAKLKIYIEDGILYLNDIAGVELDYSAEGAARRLLQEYVRYARNNLLELFEHNYRSNLINLRLNEEMKLYEGDN